MEDVLPRTWNSDALVIDGSRFCQLNCFQEAVIPILRRFGDLTGFQFERLRLISPVEAADALRAGAVPGLYGGLSREQMTRTFAIEWRRAPAGAPLPAAVRTLLDFGPVVLDVDRFDLPADERWYRTAHRPHTVLIVDVGSDGVHYLDSDHPVVPVVAPWADLPAGDTDADPPAGVASARPPAAGSRLDPEAANRVLTEPIDGLLRLCRELTLTGSRDRAAARTTGLDAVAYLNAVARSAETVAPGATAVAAVDLAARRLMMLLTGPTDRRAREASAACDRAAQDWTRLGAEAGRWRP